MQPYFDTEAAGLLDYTSDSAKHQLMVCCNFLFAELVQENNCGKFMEVLWWSGFPWFPLSFPAEPTIFFHSMGFFFKARFCSSGTGIRSAFSGTSEDPIEELSATGYGWVMTNLNGFLKFPTADSVFFTSYGATGTFFVFGLTLWLWLTVCHGKSSCY